MQNVTLTKEQLCSIVDQLSDESRNDLMQELLQKEWLKTPEAKSLKERSDRDVSEGRTLTIDQARKRLAHHG